MDRKMAVMTAFFVLLSGVAFAADAAAAAPVATSVAPLWKTILVGAVSGAVAAVYGWLKNRDVKTDQQEQFDVKYLVCTAMVGAILGGIAGWKGLPDPVSAYDWLTHCGIGSLILPGGEMILKAIFRQSAPRLIDILKVFTTGPTVPLPEQKPTEQK
jgi:hypothetical protein